ncbi:MAG: hypothetical protein M3067_11965 [Chloroflexota bacterium]|nr:hypothetical protein [Chloroflexota bacterium]
MNARAVPDDALHGAEAIATALAALGRLAIPQRPWARGWATVELDRAEREVSRAFAGHGSAMVSDAADDDLLAARCRLLEFGGSFRVVLLEPSTEGRLAATLARFGEGFVSLYVVVPDLDALASAGGLDLSSEGMGPFGRQRLVAGGPAWGAHLLLTGNDAATVGETRGATIGS